MTPEVGGTENVGAPAGAPPPSTVPDTSQGAPPVTAPTQAPAKPASFQEALQKASTAASSADGGLQTPSASADARVQPPAGPQPEQDAAWLGIPEGRRNTILQNARKAERDAVEQELGWARNVTPQQVDTAFGYMQRIASNPVQFVVDLIGEIRQIPQGAAMLQQALGNGNGQLPAEQKPWEMPKGRKYRTDTGSEVELFEAGQVVDILNNFREQMRDEFQNELGPLSEYQESLQEREHIVGIIHEARQETSQLMEEMRSLPHFKESEPQIADVLERMDPRVKQRLGAIASLHTAFQIVLRDHVYPNLEKSVEEKIRQRGLEKANAGAGSIQPGQQQPSGKPKKPTTPEELAKHMAGLAARAS